MTLSEVADLISSDRTELLQEGNYHNRRGVRGYFIQAKSGDHWCRVSVSHVDHHAGCITLQELLEINVDHLETPIKIMRKVIASALRVAAQQGIVTKQYENVSGVTGIWSECYVDSSWYMVSVSQIDIPTCATAMELDRIADVFLSQQGYSRRTSRTRYRARADG